MKKSIIIPASIITVLLSAQSQAQVMPTQQATVSGSRPDAAAAPPVSWMQTAKKLSQTEALIIIKATLKPGYRIYSQQLKSGGPMKTSFTFQPSSDYSLIGTVSEPSFKKAADAKYHMEVAYFENTVTFTQKIRLNKPSARVLGIVEYMPAMGDNDLEPTQNKFELLVK